MGHLLWPGSRFWVRTVSTTVCHVLRELNGTRTTPLKSDQMVEHFKRTLKTMISLFLKNTLARPELSPLRLMLSRSAVYETAGCTPSEMMFGRGSRVLPDLLYGRPEPDENSRDVTSDAEKVRERLETRWRHFRGRGKRPEAELRPQAVFARLLLGTWCLVQQISSTSLTLSSLQPSSEGRYRALRRKCATNCHLIAAVAAEPVGTEYLVNDVTRGISCTPASEPSGWAPGIWCGNGRDATSPSENKIIRNCTLNDRSTHVIRSAGPGVWWTDCCVL